MNEIKEYTPAKERMLRELRKMRRTLDSKLRETREEVKELQREELRLIFRIDKLDKAGESSK